MKVRSLIVCGTGTGVGKTVVTAALAAAWPRSAGSLALAKPVQTGCGRGLWPPDLAFCRRYARWQPLVDEPLRYCPYAFKLAASPHLAAAREGRSIDVRALTKSMRLLQQSHDGVLVEGAGGLLTPLSERTDLSALFAQLDLPVLLVAHAGLGTLNHVLLTVEALKKRTIALCAVVLTRTSARSAALIEAENRRYLSAHLAHVPVLVMPYLGRRTEAGFEMRLRRAGVALWRGIARGG